MLLGTSTLFAKYLRDQIEMGENPAKKSNAAMMQIHFEEYNLKQKPDS